VTEQASTRAVRPGFGPTLPELLRRRFGIPPRRTTVGAVLAAVVVVAAIVAVRAAKAPTQLTHRGTPTFNLTYDSPLHEVAPAPGELVRLAAATRRAHWTLSVTALAVPPFRGDIGHALLPILADRQVRQLAGAYPRFGVIDEGRAQIDGLPGYQVGFVAENGRLHGRDVMILPADRGVRVGVLVSFRQRDTSRILGPREMGVATAVKKSLRSFAFGTSRP
jgi:hypothetical protein